MRALPDGRVCTRVEPVETLAMGDIAVPGDFSSAAFLHCGGFFGARAPR